MTLSISPSLRQSMRVKYICMEMRSPTKYVLQGALGDKLKLDRSHKTGNSNHLFISTEIVFFLFWSPLLSQITLSCGTKDSDEGNIANVTVPPSHNLGTGS